MWATCGYPGCPRFRAGLFNANLEVMFSPSLALKDYHQPPRSVCALHQNLLDVGRAA